MTLVKFKPVARNYNWLNDVFNESTNGWNTAIPPVNITDNPNAYQLTMSVPGRNKEDFKVSMEKGLLTVSYEKKNEETGSEVKSIRKEFSFESFKRSFSIDETIDTEKIEAKYENGLLIFDLPKKEQQKPVVKQISVQ